MKILVDEGVEKPIVDALRELGHDVLWVAQHQPGLSDTQVIQLATQDDRLLVTYDKGFGALVFVHGYRVAGVVLMRLAGLSTEQKRALTERHFSQLGERLLGHFTVITARGVRIRPL